MAAAIRGLALSFVRPEVKALFQRWGEAACGALVAGAGIYLVLQRGWIAIALGAMLAALGLGWCLLGLRRARFQGEISAPGLVEIDEGRLRYLHPRLGGDISLNDLAELRLVSLRGRRVWQLQDLSGRRLLVPLEAAGAAALFDALSALPDLHSADLVEAIGTPVAVAGGAGLPVPALDDRLVWCRKGTGLRTV